MTEPLMTAVCGVREASCICGLEPGHGGPHECVDTEVCGGSWHFDDEGNFVSDRLPGKGLAVLFAMLGLI